MVKAQERAKASRHWTECEERLLKAKKVVTSLALAPNEAALVEAKAKVKVAALAVTAAAEAFQRACRP